MRMALIPVCSDNFHLMQMHDLSDVPAPVYTGSPHVQGTPAPRSKWDEIREANAGQSKQSAWDSLRKEGNSSKSQPFDKDED